LARQQIIDDGFEGGVGLGGLAINPARLAKVIEQAEAPKIRPWAT
jgi:hypothetical protein